MTYVEVLDPTTPATTESAGNGDDRIRELKRSIIERVESFFTDIDTDPWVPKAGSIPWDIFSDGTLPGSLLQDASVPLTKLSGSLLPGSGAVVGGMLADGSVTTAKIADLNVTTAKLALGAIGTDQVAAGGIKRANLYAGLKSDLVRWQVYTLILGSTVLGAGLVARGSVNIDTNDQVGGGVACIIEPAFAYADASGATHVTDYVLAQCSVTLNGSQEVLVYRLHNLLASTIDLTGQVYYIHMLQRLSTAPAEV